MRFLRRSSLRSWAAAALLVAAACDRTNSNGPPNGPLQIHLVTPTDKRGSSYVEVTGLSSALARTIGRSARSTEEWQRLLTVRVKTEAPSDTQPMVAGKYALNDRTIRFAPLFPFDPGRQYDVTFDPAAGGVEGQKVTTTIALPASAPAPPTYVTHVYPSGDVVPENQLRLYIHFSAPMGRRGGLEHVALLDDRGREVEDPFLPLDAEFWNDDRTRYTVFFDPGRQKRGILPNRQMGPSLVAGRTYTLVVRREWLDGNSNPLRETFTRRFRVGPPDQQPLNQKQWRIAPPAEGTRDPLTVTFPEALDHGLLLRAVGVRYDGRPVVGTLRIDANETRWALTPRDPWTPGRYELVALSFLEDLAGNRIGRAFEIDAFDRVDKDTEPEAFTIPFALAAAPQQAVRQR